jgi:uncharacterized protein YijF (DUF1287 family)
MESSSGRLNIKHLLIIILVLIIILAITISVSQFTFRKSYDPPTALVSLLPRYRVIDMEDTGIVADHDSDGINDQKDILEGAKKQLEEPAVNIFSEGVEETNYYSGGDPPPEYALSTDIVARAFANAGFDLSQLVDEDISNNFDQYPLRELWGQSYTDTNIDYRRIQNLEIFFQRNATPLQTYFDPADDLNLSDWLPGDIVFFDMDEDGFTDTAGIISDFTTREGIPKVIYNYIDPGFTVEKDVLDEKIITGHYRYP